RRAEGDADRAWMRSFPDEECPRATPGCGLEIVAGRWVEGNRAERMGYHRPIPRMASRKAIVPGVRSMCPLRRVEDAHAGPHAVGILVPPGRRTVVIVRPRALIWDLLLTGERNSLTGSPFQELTQEEA